MHHRHGQWEERQWMFGNAGKQRSSIRFSQLGVTFFHQILEMYTLEPLGLFYERTERSFSIENAFVSGRSAEMGSLLFEGR
jgi:hypothetical protein